ncbi:hypothetical protein L873DRAFT_1805173 [Choiromyces venosus 120613-1]|uniref:Uncharacterized protein n=1 Tax=Choiromyces venosus 120613-1 TaxID=1336337 RepID=A0A3N4JTM5_9PEZI|nr:hypothetical protein L873DRAFT_1805173 [Choiromyces venosus 120613-1]
MSKSRISRIDSDFDPAFGWETIDFPDPTAYPSTHPSSPGTPYAPSGFQYGQHSSGGHGHGHSHSRTEEFSRTRHGEPIFSSPEISPQMREAPEGGIPESLRITSPLSPTFTRTGNPRLNPPYAAASAQTYGFQTNSHKRRSAIENSIPQLPPPTVGGFSNNSNNNRNSVVYDIPAPPPPPTILMDFDDTDYERVRLTEHNRISREGGSGGGGGYLESGGWNGPDRQPSIARRLGDKILGTVGGRGSRLSSRSYLGTIRDRGGGFGDGRGEGNYAKVDEGDDEEPLGYDISSFGADFIPAPAVKAMEDHNMDADYVYTGTGEAIDLSSFSGGGNSDERRDSDAFSLYRAGTMENTDKQSYYFPPNRVIPNWKPIAMRPWFIAWLLLCSLSLIACVETLYQFSDRGLIREGGKRGIIAFKRVDRDLTMIGFAMWKYLPTLIAVIYGILWKITDTEVKRTEPYYQLSKGSKGALAASTLNIEYHTFWSLLVPLAAIKHRQWLVVASSIASLLAFALVPVLLSAFIQITPSQRARQNMKIPGTNQPMRNADIEKTIVVDKVFSRILEATVAIIFLLGTGMFVVLSRRRSGLLGDPSGIAGVAAMANKAHILMDFKDLDSASEEAIHKQLNKRTYILHKGALWQAQFLKENERDVNAPKAMNPHPLFLRLKGGLPFIAFLVALCGVLTPLAYGPLNIVVDKTPWVLTGISVLIKSIWEIVEKDMRMLEPFWALFNRHASSSILTLDYSATIPGFLVLKAASKGHFLLAWVGFVSLLVEVLTVVMGSLDSTGGEESGLSFTVSFVLAVIILCVTILTMGLVLHRRRHPFLPRQPGTISSVLAFIHQSKMLVDFEGTEEESTAVRKKKLRKLGHTYGFGWFWGRDGKRHLGIDHEELLQGYEFGKSVLDGVLDPVVDWEHYQV